jgi:DNA-binding ferritin-like protein
MKNLAILLRALQLLAHINHNTVVGPAFFADHAMLSDLYTAYETAYDSIIERMIGTGSLDPKQLLDIQQSAVDVVKSATLSTDAAAIFKALSHGEAELQRYCSTVKGSTGTLNLVAQLADDSEVRNYKLKQRTK